MACLQLDNDLIEVLGARDFPAGTPCGKQEIFARAGKSRTCISDLLEDRVE